MNFDSCLIRSRLFQALQVPSKQCPILHAWAIVENRKFCHEFMGALLCREGTEKAVRIAVGRQLDALAHFLGSSTYHFGTIERGGGKNRETTSYGLFTPNRAVSYIQERLATDPDTANPFVAIDRYVNEAIARHIPKTQKKSESKKKRLPRKRRGVAWHRHTLGLTSEAWEARAEKLQKLAGCTFTDALRLARLGFPVFAVWGVTAQGICRCPKAVSCANPGKHPIPTGWQQIATTYMPTLVKFWERHPFSNVGIATGRKMPNGEFLTVIDIDERHFGHGSLSHLERNELCPLPLTREHSAGGGPHKFVTHARGFHSSPGALGQGVDVQSFGKFVIGAGLNARGSIYELTVDAPIAPLPDVWADRIDAVRNKTLPLIPEGQRRAWLLSCAGGMVRDRMNPELIFEVLKDRRERRCEKGTHSFTDDDLRGMVTYCLRQEQVKRAERAA